MSSPKHKKLIDELKRSRKLIGEIYPVLKTKDGRILVGKHRAAAGWQKAAIIDDQVQALAEKLGVSLKEAEIVYIIHSNTQRRPQKAETQSLVIQLCEQREKNGTPREKVASEVVKFLPYNPRYALSLIPDEYKQQQKAVSPGRPPQFVNFKLTKKPGYEILPPIQVPSQVYQEFVASAKEANLDIEELIVQLIRSWLEQHKPLQSKTKSTAKKLRAEDVLAGMKELWGTRPFTPDDVDKQLRPILGISEDELYNIISELINKKLLQYEEERDFKVIYKLTTEVKPKPAIPEEAVKLTHLAAVINKPLEQFKSYILSKFPDVNIDDLLKAAQVRVENGVMRV
jgi:hypothetical protein